jgi:hypothetical protein
MQARVELTTMGRQARVDFRFRITIKLGTSCARRRLDEPAWSEFVAGEGENLCSQNDTGPGLSPWPRAATGSYEPICG